MGELIVFIVVVTFVKKLLTDAAYAVRGLDPPSARIRMEKLKRAGSPTPARTGARDYFADLWHDSWQDARVRRADRRATPAEPPAPTPQTARAPDPAPNDTTSRSTRRTPKIGERYTDPNGRVMEWAGDEWAPVCTRCDIPMAGHDGQGWLRCEQCQRRAVDDRPEPTPDQPLATVIQLHNRQEETVTATAETTSLTRAKAFAGDMSAANEAMIPQIEMAKAHMVARKVTGRPIVLCDQLMEIYRTAAATAQEMYSELARQDRLQEEYRANQDAGDKEFQVAE